MPQFVQISDLRPYNKSITYGIFENEYIRHILSLHGDFNT